MKVLATSLGSEEYLVCVNRAKPSCSATERTDIQTTSARQEPLDSTPPERTRGRTTTSSPVRSSHVPIHCTWNRYALSGMKVDTMTYSRRSNFFPPIRYGFEM